MGVAKVFSCVCLHANSPQTASDMRRGEDKDAQHLQRLAALMRRRTRRVEQLKSDLFQELNKPVAAAKQHQHGGLAGVPATASKATVKLQQYDAGLSHEHSTCKAEPGANGDSGAAAVVAAAKAAAKRKRKEEQRAQKLSDARAAKRARIAEQVTALQETKAHLLQEQSRLLQQQASHTERMQDLEAKLSRLSEEKHRLFLMMKEVLSSQASATPAASMHMANGAPLNPLASPAATFATQLAAPLMQQTQAAQHNTPGGIQHPAAAAQSAPIVLTPPSITSFAGSAQKTEANAALFTPGSGQEQSVDKQEAGGAGLQGKEQAASIAAAATSRHGAGASMHSNNTGRTRPAFGQRSRGPSGGGVQPQVGAVPQQPMPQDSGPQQPPLVGLGAEGDSQHSHSDEEGELVEEGEVRTANHPGAAPPNPPGSRPGVVLVTGRSQSLAGAQPAGQGRDGDYDSPEKDRVRDKDRFGSGGGHWGERHGAWPSSHPQGEVPSRSEHGGGRGDGFPGPRSSSGGGYVGPPQRSYSFGGGPVGFGRGGRGGRFGGPWGSGSQGGGGPGRHGPWHER